MNIYINAMDTASHFDLAGFCLLAVIQAGVLALRLGITLQKS